MLLFGALDAASNLLFPREVGPGASRKLPFGPTILPSTLRGLAFMAVPTSRPGSGWLL